jgi:hypothetical protein
MRSSRAAPDPAKSGAKYTVRTRCPQCGRKHITVFRVRQCPTASSCSWGTSSATRGTLNSSDYAGARTRGNIRNGARLKEAMVASESVPNPTSSPAGC